MCMCIYTHSYLLAEAEPPEEGGHLEGFHLARVVLVRLLEQPQHLLRIKNVSAQV